MTDPLTPNSNKEALRIWLFNPFHFVAGWTALCVGLAIVVVASLNGSVSHSHFDGVFDFHTGAHVPLWLHVFEGLVDWSVMALLLWVAGLLISKSRMRALDVFGTQAFARFPTLVTVVFALLPGYQRQAARLAVMNTEVVAGDVAAFGVVAFVTIVTLVWMVVLMYRGFAVSCNVKGAKAIMTFILVSLLGEVVSKVILVVVINKVLG